MTTSPSDDEFSHPLLRHLREVNEEAAETDRETYTEGEEFPFSACYFAGFHSRSHQPPSQRRPRRRREEDEE
jgi:hypothetical protein